MVERSKIGGMKKVHCRLPNLMVEKDPRLNQRRLGQETGLSHTTINKLYNGQPLKARIDPETIERLCDYFGCQIGDLLVLKDEVND